MDRHSPALAAAWAAIVLAMAGCAAVPGPEVRARQAQALALAHGWQGLTLQTRLFALRAFLPPTQGQASQGDLTVYIEGDGLAWITPSRPSADPTPADPLALRLALAQPEGSPAGAVAYLARPCQYVGAEATGCAPRYWTQARFAPEVIDATSQALDQLLRRVDARRLTLVGYSGGGAVAALVAARRHDVRRLVTVAGNLDTDAWTAWHQVPPLRGSLNPADDTTALRNVPQWHAVGERDTVIPPGLVQGFAQRFPAGQRPTVVVVPQVDHGCCWPDRWPALWRQAVRDTPRQGAPIADIVGRTPGSP